MMVYAIEKDSLKSSYIVGQNKYFVFEKEGIEIEHAILKNTLSSQMKYDIN